MKILYHKGNIHFQGFGGKNFVIPDKSEGDVVLATLQAAINAQVNYKSEKCTCNAYQLENYGCKCGKGA